VVQAFTHISLSNVNSVVSLFKHVSSVSSVNCVSKKKQIVGELMGEPLQTTDSATTKCFHPLPAMTYENLPSMACYFQEGWLAFITGITVLSKLGFQAFEKA